jgi:hypothetical protein
MNVKFAGQPGHGCGSGSGERFGELSFPLLAAAPDENFGQRNDLRSLRGCGTNPTLGLGEIGRFVIGRCHLNASDREFPGTHFDAKLGNDSTVSVP